MTTTGSCARNCLPVSGCLMMRALTSYLCFDSWGDLITFMLRSFEPGRVVPVRLEPSPPLEPAPS